MFGFAGRTAGSGCQYCVLMFVFKTQLHERIIVIIIIIITITIIIIIIGRLTCA